MMKRIFGAIFDVRRGEILLTMLMFASYYLLLVTYYLLKPARDSLFLVKVSPTQLPLVFIITALVTVPVVSLYNRASRSIRLDRLITITTAVLIVNLFILRWLVQWDAPWIYYLFYTWVSIYGALSTSQFWLLSNAVYDASQAKRIFVLLGLGGIIGAFTGGWVTGLVVTYFGVSTADLLFFCVGLLAVVAVLINIVWRLERPEDAVQPPHRREKAKEKEKFSQVYGTIKGSRHLTLIVGIIAITMMVASFVDYQFKVVSKEAFSTTQELTAFLGQFYGGLSLVSLVLQLLFTYRFIRILGVGGAILFLPLGLLAGSAAMFVFPGLLAAVLLRGADGSLKYSIDKTGRELLFLPVPLEIKKRTKIFIDMFIDRWFRGLAGGLLLLCTMVLSLSVRQLSIVVIVLVVIWLIMALMMRKEYVNAFRLALEKRHIDLDELDVNITDAQALGALITALKSTREREIVYALDMLATVQDKRLIEPLVPLCTHESVEIRRRTVRLLRQQQDSSILSRVEPLRFDDDPEVRQEAIAAICELSPEDKQTILSRFLNDDDLHIRSATVGCISEYGDDEDKRLIDEETIGSLLNVEGRMGEVCRLQLARAFGSVNRPSLRSGLHRLMDDTSMAVVRQTIDSLGRLREREHVPWLIEKLADRAYRPQARAALAAYGVDILGTLGDYLLDTKIAWPIRRNIPRVIAGIPDQRSVDALTEYLEAVEPRLRYYVVKALNRLRTAYRHLKFPTPHIDAALLTETKSYYETVRILQLHRQSDTPSGRLLARALIERQDQNLEQIFRLLGLAYPPQDIYNAYLGLVSNRKTLRANAVEFLDNLLRGDVKKLLEPILDDPGADTAARRLQEQFGLRLETKEQALLHLMRGGDCWLKACAIHDAGAIDSPEIRIEIEKAAADTDPIVRETAELMLARTG